MLIAGQIPQALATGKYENVYVSVFNNETTLTCPQGGHVCYQNDATAAQFLGRAVRRPATADLAFYAGVAAFDIAPKVWGLVCTYGVFETAFVDGGTTDIAVGNYLTAVNGSFYANAPTAFAAGTGWIHAMAAVTATSVTARCFIRAM